LKLQENISLASFTTLRVGGPARYMVEARTESEVKGALRFASERQLPLLVLGGGSNLLIADEGWPGLVLKIALRGIEFGFEKDKVLFYAGAGENWDDLVALTVERNCAGLECLTGIPGTVGGTPVQNVGAYGQEVSQTIRKVRVLEIATGNITELSNDACGFAYRSSILNGSKRGQYIVLEVGFQLTQDGEPTLVYGDVKKFFSNSTNRPSLQQVREAVKQIRQSKAMLLVRGDEDCRSAGSFFKNPLVSAAEAKRIQALALQRVPDKTMPQFPAADGKVKLAAAWLVEQSGFHKGYSRGPVGISRKHSLAIVNRGGATAKEIIAFKNEVEQKVFETWGVRLQPEPVFVGFDRQDS